MTKKTILIPVLILGILVLNWVNSRELIFHYDLSEITPYTYFPKSINIEGNNFDDLAFLDEILKDKDIVLLGEQVHRAGSTFKAKGRLIKYLHEYHGFDVVLYEAGLYDMWLMNENAQTVSDTAHYTPSTGLHQFWWNNEECKALWEYYNTSLKTDNPIRLGGFDCQVTGKIKNRELLLSNFLKTKALDINKYSNFKDAIKELEMQYMWQYKRFKAEEFDSIQKDMTNIIEKIGERNTFNDEVYYRYLKGMKDYTELMWNYSPGAMPRMNKRDSIMAANLKWQIEDVFNGRKVIVWLANVHLFKSSIYDDAFTPLGKYINDEYPERSYMMAFTSYALENKKTGDTYNEAGYDTFEAAMHALKHQYMFIDLSKLSSGTFLSKEFRSTMDQRMGASRNWVDLVDGIFYIDRE